jgi:hypothetical protein
MLEKYKTAVASATPGNYITPAGRMMWPDLFKKTLPRGETNKDKASYQITLLFPKGVNLDVLKKAVEDLIAENVSAKVRQTANITMPWKKTADQPRFADLADEYPVMLRCSAQKYRPEVVSPNGRDLIAEEQEADEVYSGRWCRVSLNPFFYDHPTGGKGVSFGLSNVQLLDHDEAIGPGKVKAAAEFAPATDLDPNDPLAF